MGGGEELALQLLERADDDVAAARALLDVDNVSDLIVGFHAQQAVEKALKAVLAMHVVEYPFTHDLELLVALCERAGITLPAELADVPRLSPYAAQLRYGPGGPSIVHRSTALRWATVAVEYARGATASAQPRE
jgi:HEPN domain-containing protein